MQNDKQARDATQIDATGCNNAGIGEGIALWNYGPARRQVRRRVGFNIYLRRVRDTAKDRLRGLLNRVKRQGF